MQPIEPLPISKDRMREIRREAVAAPVWAPVSKMPPIPAANGATSAHWMAPLEDRKFRRKLYCEGGSSPGVYTFEEAYGDDPTCEMIAAMVAALDGREPLLEPTPEQMADLE